MSEQIPDFDTEQEMRDSFDTADLSTYRLNETLDVVIASTVELSFEGGSTRGSAGATGPSGTIKYDLIRR